MTRTTGTNGGNSNAHGNGHQSNKQEGAKESAMTFTQRSAAGDATEASTAATPAPVPAPSLSTVSVSKGTTLVRFAVMMAQAAPGGIDPNWILLDSQSTISVFRNASMLRNIRNGPHVLHAITNGGHQDSSMIGDFPNLGPVWYNESSIAKILSLSKVQKVCTVTMHGHIEGTGHQRSSQGRNHSEFC